MEQQNTQTSSGANGGSSLCDLFALTDEQILEIEPEAQDAEISAAAPDAADGAENAAANPAASDPQAVARETSATETAATQNSSGPFSAPEDLRTLAELYPGGLNQAKTAAERARVLDDIDRAYFGTAGKSAEETNASRAQLAARMIREDPAAFREMVFAGLRALEEANVAPRSGIGASLAAEIAPQARDAGLKPGATEHSAASAANQAAQQPAEARAANQEAQVTAYAAFEKAANEELERSVGGAIARTIEQALPALAHGANASTVGAQHAAPLQARLNAAIRQDVEQALEGDRQLSEQIAQILSGRRFDNETRAQVVRLIDERARQLVPVAAKRALNEWTQTTLAAHRGKSGRAEAASSRREAAPASPGERRPVAPVYRGGTSLPANSQRPGRTSAAGEASMPNRGATRTDGQRVDYRKLSDEQILDL